jgi:Family of unknown function (DUF6134)
LKWCRRTLCLATPGLLAARIAQSETRQFVFQILRNGRPIGRHRTQIQESGRALTAQSEADIAITLGGVSIFRFSQRLTEEWHEGRLISASGNRNRNGFVTKMFAGAEADSVAVRGPAGSFRLPAKAAPLSWWDQDRFDRPLFAIDTGEPLTRLLIRFAPLPGGGRLVRVSGDGDTESRYGADGRWLGWQSRAEDGSIIAYAPA